MNSGRGRRIELLFLAALLLLSLGLRFYRLGQASLSEDEAAKWTAIQKYRHGHFAGVNSEHPMVMKMLAWGSLDAGEHYDRWALAHGWPHIRDVAWLRLPIALLGSLTALVLYWLGRQMIGPLGAGLAAFFWAVSPLSISMNRVLKEENLFVFFTLAAFACYNRGKLALSDRESKKWFLLSGAVFGMGQAAYYLTIAQFGLIVLIWHIANQGGIRSRDMGPYFRRMVVVMGLVFLLCNPVVLSPKDLGAMLRYSEEKTIQHRGYLVDGQVYLNNALTTPFGLPWYFYIWVFLVKTPIPIIAAAAAGIALLFFDRTSLISIFLRVTLTFWFVPYALFGSKWIRYLVIILPSVYLAAGWAVDRVYAWAKGRRWAWRPAVAAAVLTLVAWPAANALAWTPYNRLYLNAFGGGRKNVGRFFPPDEVYDLGVREADQYVARVAPHGAVVSASDPMGTRYYMHRFGRPDIRIVPLFDPDYEPRSGDYILVQASRRYFETSPLINLIRRTHHPLLRVRDDGLDVVEVYRF